MYKSPIESIMFKFRVAVFTVSVLTGILICCLFVYAFNNPDQLINVCAKSCQSCSDTK